MASRPGGTTCKYCGHLFEYNEMTRISSRLYACDDCLERREKLGIK